MKTSVILQSKERNLMGTTIRQDTKTGFLCLTDLESCYEFIRKVKGWSARKTTDILRLESNHERLYHIIEEIYAMEVSKFTFTEMVDLEGFKKNMKKPAKYLKHIGVYKSKGARNTRAVYAHPYIWMLVAMELNPKIYAKAIIWLSDTLVANRIEAGNFYKGFSKAVAIFNPNPSDYMRFAKGLNYIVFGKHKTGIRNEANSKELEKLTDVQKKLAFAIDMGYITTKEGLLKEMKKMWRKNHKMLLS